ncbi:hypothetical protein JCGZ_03838 [Jatropha curcas]|uniref:Uncharacterized protein n=1 Tax=Jatropha curcas TaxID=180498 RepID=A0A067KZL4_JATCU|nr:hypothetical protein JCGZ_03838 [Jatropha curcas]
MEATIEDAPDPRAHRVAMLEVERLVLIMVFGQGRDTSNRVMLAGALSWRMILMTLNDKLDLCSMYFVFVS